MKQYLRIPIILFSIIFFNSTLCFSQNIEILSQNPDYRFEKDPSEFYSISKDLDASIGTRVADIQLTIQKENEEEKYTLVPMFYKLWEKANSMGSNAFYISETNYSESDKMYFITVELWFLDKDQIDENYELYPENLIYIIGNLNTKKENNGKKFRLNGEKVTVMPYQYLYLENPDDKPTTIHVGGMFGSGVAIKRESGKLPRFFSLGGFNLAPVYSGGISISGGSVYQLDMNLGYFLIGILPQQQDKTE